MVRKHNGATYSNSRLQTLLGDVLSLLVLLAIFALLLFPPSRKVYVELNKAHPYLMGFVKVAILATFGEILSKRISLGRYEMPYGVHLRAIVWGLLGICFVAVFELFFSGTRALLEKGLLPFTPVARSFFQALYTSVFMNLMFAPVFMAAHRVTDAYIDLARGRVTDVFKVRFNHAIESVDWRYFVNFVLFKTIPFFWIPAHTVTFLLPENFRILTAALLSIVLGVLLSLRRKHSAGRWNMRSQSTTESYNGEVKA